MQSMVDTPPICSVYFRFNSLMKNTIRRQLQFNLDSSVFQVIFVNFQEFISTCFDCAIVLPWSRNSVVCTEKLCLIFLKINLRFRLYVNYRMLKYTYNSGSNIMISACSIKFSIYRSTISLAISSNAVKPVCSYII